MYTPEMKRLVHSIKPPNDFVLDIMEMPPMGGSGGKPFYAMRFYESHWRYLNESERLKCIDYITKVRAVFKAYGYESTLDPVYDVKETKWFKK